MALLGNTPKRNSAEFQDLYDGIGVLRVQSSDSNLPTGVDLQPENIHLFFSMEGDVSFQFGPMPRLIPLLTIPSSNLLTIRKKGSIGQFKS